MKQSFIAGIGAGLFASAIILSPAMAADVRGVTDTQITVGTVTDLSGVTAVDGVNSSNALRLAFDDLNAQGGVNGRKINYVVEDSQYQVARAVQAMNKLLNSDNVFFTIQDSGTSMNNATMQMAHDKGVPKLLPLSAAVSMYEPFDHLKFAMFPSNVELMRAGVKYFVENRNKKTVCALYNDTDFGRDVLNGATEQLKAENMTLAATATDHPDDIAFQATLTKLRQANCDLVVLGTLDKDTIIILTQARQMGWDVDFLGQFATYETEIAEQPGGIAEGFYSMSPSLFAYPDDTRPAVHDLLARYHQRFGIDFNYNGESSYAAAQIAIEALKRAGKDLTVDSLISAMESIDSFTDVFGTTYHFSPTNHHGSSMGFLSVVKDKRWVPVTNQQLGF